MFTDSYKEICFKIIHIYIYIILSLTNDRAKFSYCDGYAYLFTFNL